MIEFLLFSRANQFASRDEACFIYTNTQLCTVLWQLTTWARSVRFVFFFVFLGGGGGLGAVYAGSIISHSGDHSALFFGHLNWWTMHWYPIPVRLSHSIAQEYWDCPYCCAWVHGAHTCIHVIPTDTGSHINNACTDTFSADSRFAPSQCDGVTLWRRLSLAGCSAINSPAHITNTIYGYTEVRVHSMMTPMSFL